MAYLSRHYTRKRSSLSAESVCLLLVLIAALVTAWWAGHDIGMDLSVIQRAAAFLGVTETVSTTRPVGYSEATAEQETTPPAPYCPAGQQPAFNNGMAMLKQRVGAAMGAPVECEHPTTAAGDTVQQTSTGLAAYTQKTNTVTFTDGWRHWAITPAGYVTWEGSESNPPRAASSDSAGG